MPKKVSKKKPSPPPSIHSEPSSAEESDGGLSERLSPRHSPQHGSAREQSPDYHSDEEALPKQESPTQVPSKAAEAPRSNSHDQSDSDADHSDSSSSGSDEGSGEDSNVVSGDNKKPAKSSPERVDISSDSEPDKGAIGSGSPKEQAGSASSPPNVAVSQAFSSPRKFTAGSEPDASPKLAVLSQNAEERPGKQPPQPSVSSPSKRDKKFLFQPQGNSAQPAPADESQADGSPERGKLEGMELEEENPDERQEKRMRRKARNEKLREAHRQSEASAQRAAEIPAPSDRASPPNHSSEQEGRMEQQPEKRKNKGLSKAAKKTASRADKRSREPPPGERDAPAMLALVEQLNKQAKQIANLTHEVVEAREEAHKLREGMRNAGDENFALGITVREQQDRLQEQQSQLLAQSAPKPMENPEYRTRFEWLVQRGWTMAEAEAALEATKQGGSYSSTRADTHLKAVSDQARVSAVAKANAQMAATNDESPSIAEDSSCASVLSKNMDAVDIIIKLKTTHAQTKARAAHTAQTAVGAANLVQLPSIANDLNLARKGPTFLGQAALAVCEDCTKCTDLRAKFKQDLQEKERVRLAKEEAEASKRKAQEAKAAENKKRAANRPIQLNFRAVDSKRDVTLPRGLCGNPTCGKGYEAGKWLYGCKGCKRGYHLDHTEFTLFMESNGKELWLCTPCIEQRESLEGLGQMVVSDIENHRAPDHQEAADDRPSIDDDERPANTDKLSGGRAPTSTGGPTPNVHFVPSTPSTGTAGGGGDGPHHHNTGNYSSDLENSAKKELNFSSGNFTNGEAAIMKAPHTVTMKEYLVWNPIPKEWKAPIKNGVPQDHPTDGWSKTAYQNWRRKNLNLRDTHVAGKDARGPLSKAISVEQKTLVGSHLMLHPDKISHLWPKWNRLLPEGENVRLWCEEDASFTWVNRLDDVLLLQLLDTHFGVEKADSFLSRRFVPELPPTNQQGEINYHSLEFARWSTEWQSELAELSRAGGSALMGIDLRQTLLNALCDCKLLHKHASQLQAPSAVILLAMMRKWTAEKDGETISRMSERASFTEAADAANKSASHSEQQKDSPQKTKVLLSQAQGGAQGGMIKRAPPSKIPPSPNLKLCGKFDELFKCEGCGNNWQNSRSFIPCSPVCRYHEHPEFNREWRTRPYNRRVFLTWKDFRERFPHITNLPKDLLEWEAKDKAYQASKRAGDPAVQPESKRT
jgi:hypothetical protein